MVIPSGIINLSTHTDGAELLIDDTNVSLFEVTENPLAPKDVLVIVPHGVCGVNGATSTIICLGKDTEKVRTNTCTENIPL